MLQSWGVHRGRVTFCIYPIAGFTIFIGLPIALIPAQQKIKNFLNSIATGILVFILFDVLEYAWEEVEHSFENQVDLNAYLFLLIMGLGLAIGLIGIALYQSNFMSIKDKNSIELATDAESTIQKIGMSPSRLSLMIAIGIGVHNLSEGLAIGQSFAQGEISLAILLVIGLY